MFQSVVIPVTVLSGPGSAPRTTDNIRFHYLGDIPYAVSQEGEQFQIFDGSPGPIIEVSDAYFVPSSMCLYDRNGVRITESCFRRGKGLTELVNCGASTISLPTDFVTVDKPMVYLSGIWDHWGHFLTEGTSRLWALLEYPELSAMTGFYLPGVRLHRNIMEFIRSLNLDIRLGGFAGNRSVRFRKVFIPTASFSNRGEAYSVHRKPPASVTELHLPGSCSPASEQPVFLSRSRFGARREVQNQVELESALEEKGFLVVRPEQLSLAEQIALFNRHRHFCGCWGSAFHSAIFCKLPENLTTHIICDCIPNANFLMFDSILKNEAHYVRSMFPVPGRQQVWPDYCLAIEVEQALSYFRAIA